MTYQQKKQPGKDARIGNAADYIAAKLTGRGCMIHRYDAQGTNSIYLKVDAGVACSIRLSDHNGYTHLKYRFNYMANVPGSGVERIMDEHDRYYYQADAIDQLIADVIALRNQRKKLYPNYDALIRRSIAEGEKQKGFWQRAYCVNHEQNEEAA